MSIIESMREAAREDAEKNGGVGYSYRGRGPYESLYECQAKKDKRGSYRFTWYNFGTHVTEAKVASMLATKGESRE